MAWKITEDLISDGDSILSAVGAHHGTLHGPTRYAELYDDDNIHYFTAEFDLAAEELEDGEYGSLYDLFQWGMVDSGTTDLRIDGVSIFS